MLNHKNLTSKLLLATAIGAACTSIASAGDTLRCDLFSFEGVTEQSPPDGIWIFGANLPFEGEINFTNLETDEVQSAQVTTVMLGLDGSGGSRTSHEILGTGGNGIRIVTADEAQLTPNDRTPGAFNLYSQMSVVSGSGPYNCGKLVVGPVSFSDDLSIISFDQNGLGTAEFKGHARLCRC